MDFFEETSDKSSQDEVGVIEDEYAVVIDQQSEGNEQVKEGSEKKQSPSQTPKSSTSKTSTSPAPTKAQKEVSVNSPSKVSASSSSGAASTSPMSGANKTQKQGGNKPSKDQIKKAAKRLLSGEQSSSSDDDESSGSSSDYSTEDETLRDYVQTSVPTTISSPRSRGDSGFASGDQVTELKRLYVEDKELLIELQKRGTSYGHTYNQGQLESTFKSYLAMGGEGVKNGIAVLTFVHNFFETALLETSLESKIKVSKTNVVNLTAKVKELKTQRLLDEGYDKGMAIKVAIQERGESEMEMIKKDGEKNVMRGTNWGQAVAPNEVGNQEWLKQGISKIVVDNPEKTTGAFHSYILYRVLVFTKGGKILMVHRRFNHIKKLYKDLQSEVHCSLPKLPSEKHWLFGGNSPMFVIKRMEEVRSFLEKVTQARETINSRAMREFCLIGAQWRDASEGY